jgi:hypothetical protein
LGNEIGEGTKCNSYKGIFGRTQLRIKRGRACKEIRQTSNDVEEQNVFANVKGKRSLIFYCEIKLLWAREEYVTCCSSKVRSGIAWFKAGIWNLRG